MLVRNIIKKRIILHKNRNAPNIKISNTAILGVQNHFGGYNVIGNETKFVGDIGYASYVGDRCCIFAKIGKYCSLGNNIVVPLGDHPVGTWVSTHPAFFSTKEQCGITYVDKEKFQEQKYAEDKYAVVIGNDVWIGSNVVIMAGVTIGDGAVIGAGAIVTKDIPPYAVAVGVPARVSKYRFKEEEIGLLLRFKWWDKDKAWIREHADQFESFDKFYMLMKEEEDENESM